MDLRNGFRVYFVVWPFKAKSEYSIPLDVGERRRMAFEWEKTALGCERKAQKARERGDEDGNADYSSKACTARQLADIYYGV